MKSYTKGPWKWQIQDYSMASLEGPMGMEDAVMAVSPCGSCQEGAKKDGKWKWGRCQTPTLYDANLIAAAPDLLEAGKAVLYHDERGQGIGYKEAMDALLTAIQKAETATPSPSGEREEGK